MRFPHGVLLLAALLMPSLAAAEWRGHGGSVRALAISPDGSRIMSGSFDHSAILWAPDQEAALAIMGNHEFNAICYHTSDGAGGNLRSHTEENNKNTVQHQATLDQLAIPYRDEWESYLAWFKSLPLFSSSRGFAWSMRRGIWTRSESSVAGRCMVRNFSEPLPSRAHRSTRR